MTGFFILDENNNIKRTDDVFKFADFFESNKRFIRSTSQDNIKISTVFLGFDHNMSQESNIPILFETMVFINNEDVYSERYSTYQRAVIEHFNICKKFNVEYDADPNDSYQVINSIDDI